MIFRVLNTNYFGLSTIGGEGLLFNDVNHGQGVPFSQFGGIRELNDNLKRELRNDHRQKVLYLLMIRSSRRLQDILDDVNMALTDLGEFGECDLLPNGDSQNPTQKPVLLLRLRATKVGQSMDWERFFLKMEKLQSAFGFAQFGTWQFASRQASHESHH